MKKERNKILAFISNAFILFILCANAYGNGLVSIAYTQQTNEVTIAFDTNEFHHYNVILSRRKIESYGECSHSYDEVQKQRIYKDYDGDNIDVEYTFEISPPTVIPNFDKLKRSDYKVNIEYLLPDGTVRGRLEQEFIIAYTSSGIEFSQCYPSTDVIFKIYSKNEPQDEQELISNVNSPSTGSDLIVDKQYQSKPQYYCTAVVNGEESPASATLLFFISIPKKPTNLKITKGQYP